MVSMVDASGALIPEQRGERSVTRTPRSSAADSRSTSSCQHSPARSRRGTTAGEYY
jgi:hypothetical protein